MGFPKTHKREEMFASGAETWMPSSTAITESPHFYHLRSTTGSGGPHHRSSSFLTSPGLRGDGAATHHPSAAWSQPGLALPPAGVTHATEGHATVMPGVPWAAPDLRWGPFLPPYPRGRSPAQRNSEAHLAAAGRQRCSRPGGSCPADKRDGSQAAAGRKHPPNNNTPRRNARHSAAQRQTPPKSSQG